jgi:hypothetical protein
MAFKSHFDNVTVHKGADIRIALSSDGSVTTMVDGAKVSARCPLSGHHYGSSFLNSQIALEYLRIVSALLLLHFLHSHGLVCKGTRLFKTALVSRIRVLI